MKRLIIQLSGGCGNQLFQLLACYNLAIFSGRTPFYCSENIGNDIYKRKLEINEPAQALDVEEIKSSEIPGLISLLESDLNHPSFYTDYSPLKNLDYPNILIKGYFQNYRLHNLQSIYLLKSLCTKRASLIDSPKDYFSIHLREMYGSEAGYPVDNLSLEYYQKIVSLMIDEAKSNSSNAVDNVLLFSDSWKDISKSNLIQPIKSILTESGFNVIDGDLVTDKPWEIISLISKSLLIGTSNSTLSWFGAYFSNAKVFSPVNCLWQPDLRTPDNWIQIFDGNFHPLTHSRKFSYNKSIIRNNTYLIQTIIPFRRNNNLYYFLTLPIKLVRRIKNIIIFRIFRSINFKRTSINSLFS